jgi:glutaredoxin-related protein
MSPEARARMETWNRDVVDEVRAAVAANRVVVVGMAWNRSVGRVRAALDEAGIAHTYLEYGNYLAGWRKRLAIKLWSGWPTFPQVFVEGTLLGGGDHAKAAIAAGSLRK